MSPRSTDSAAAFERRAWCADGEAPSWNATRRMLLPVLLAFAACACAPATRPEPPTVATAPEPAVLASHDAALAALRAGDDATAEPLLRSLVTAHPEYAGPLVNLALLQARRGELEPATALLEQAVQACEHCAPAWNELGVLQRQQGRFIEADHAWRQSIASDPAYAMAWFNLGVLYEIYLQRPELALEHYARFRELQAADPAGEDVDKWIADLQRRTRAVERSANLEKTP